ncbi:pyridoxal-phosphate dependent enzyme [Alteromonas sp. ASW11-36]|uniref:Pyridoxal-phosphate dependent enzyme n=1 Tax=Alteromonas arenosi TaxID=3055817 RepID=A0ABT7STF3_9ALTE|nr:pyridoxal-phosphate dependent enzyme [Alteromonas sp. ASW11-36]MDM7859477.1 pyridoxal-phosphate dependent enzyme [Alteromonas sp. ASW11-36]
MFSIQVPSPLQRFYPDWPNAERYQLYVKRDDLIHPVISGNKWRKLAAPILQFAQHRPSRVASFGGGYSNHIHALAYCCWQLQIPLTVFIRGDYTGNETPMLKDIVTWQAEIVYLNKVDYQRRTETEFINQLSAQYDIDVVIPEGGSQQQCFAGMQSLADEFNRPIDALILPVASGGTLAGLSVAKHSTIDQLHGIAMLKGADYVDKLVADLIDKRKHSDYTIWHDFHHGGYAKVTDELAHFCQRHSAQLNLPLEPVYSGKALHAMQQLVSRGQFATGATLVFLHTGGLQGAR